MKKLLANLPRKPLAFISLGSLLMTGKIAVANETAKKFQPKNVQFLELHQSPQKVKKLV
ncbi:MAG: hypothetical protein AAF915_15515 [Cyanobacteria bacterium P01_D01_bin.50]